MTKLYLVSTGPGDQSLIPARALDAIKASTDLVAYRLYIDLLELQVEGLCAGKQCHQRPLGEEVERARLALDLAAGGRTTALLSSGDIGIYAMATLVLELIDGQLNGAQNHPEWLQVDIEIIPGISAMQVNSSYAGALLGHDFCTISLSDLLTPWQTIEKRIHAAGTGDFVVSFYNPVSKRRNWQLNRARDILLEYRSASTPVVSGRNLTRAGHQTGITTLGNLDACQIDMFTCVSIGNSESRHIINPGLNREWVYTPRGYAKQPGEPE